MKNDVYLFRSKQNFLTHKDPNVSGLQSYGNFLKLILNPTYKSYIIIMFVH